MEKNRPQSKQATPSQEVTPTSEQINLARTARKIAWSRMNGRNDALNPFAEAPPSQSAAPEQPGE
jgi:hypothetical protein